MLPAELSALSKRFVATRQLAGSACTRLGVWCVNDLHSGATRVLKCAQPHTLAAEPLCQHLRAIDGEGQHFVIPLEQGVSGGMGWSITPWFGDAACDLQSRLASGDWAHLAEPVVRALHRALSLLHEPQATEGRIDGGGEGSWVLHGDIKPANVLLVPRVAAPPQVLLTDFDGALLSRGSRTPTPLSRHTVRSAAPEVLGGNRLRPAADWWSLGMLVAEGALGRHPLEGLPEMQQRELLSGSWAPDLQPVEDTAWRALLGGLLQRDADLRWGAEKVERWLGGDRSTWTDGLALINEAASSTPFLVGGRHVHTAPELARAMLRAWQVVR